MTVIPSIVWNNMPVPSFLAKINALFVYFTIIQIPNHIFLRWKMPLIRSCSGSKLLFYQVIDVISQKVLFEWRVNFFLKSRTTIQIFMPLEISNLANLNILMMMLFDYDKYQNEKMCGETALQLQESQGNLQN